MAPLTRPSSAAVSRGLSFAVACALFAVFALPGYAAGADPATGAEHAAGPSQSLEVSAQALITGVNSEGYASAGSASTASVWRGPSVSELLANPPYPEFDLDALYQTALSYRGTPYAYGGDSPAGFDCSGYVMYVYALYGLALPHSSEGQAALGQPIAEADARPGDIVVMPGHNGFWAGPGQILHSPYPGSSVRVQSIWDSYYIVRLGV